MSDHTDRDDGHIDCNCGFGGFHDDVNPRCRLNQSGMTPERLAEIEARADAAAEHVGRLCTKEARWTMSVPVREDDSDVMLMAVAGTDVPDLLAEVKRLRAGIESLAEWWQRIPGDGGYEVACKDHARQALALLNPKGQDQ